jgi:hypothetical protein
MRELVHTQAGQRGNQQLSRGRLFYRKELGYYYFIKVVVVVAVSIKNNNEASSFTFLLLLFDSCAEAEVTLHHQPRPMLRAPLLLR